MNHLVSNKLALELTNVLPGKCDIVMLQRVLMELGVYESQPVNIQNDKRNVVGPVLYLSGK
jgi:hypothetical protein